MYGLQIDYLYFVSELHFKCQTQAVNKKRKYLVNTFVLFFYLYLKKNQISTKQFLQVNSQRNIYVQIFDWVWLFLYV